MASWTKHLDAEHHPTDDPRERSHFEREGINLADYHKHLHSEYDENTTMAHSHDEAGQLLFRDRRAQTGPRHNHKFNPQNPDAMRSRGECPGCDAMWTHAAKQVPSNPFEGLG